MPMRNLSLVSLRKVVLVGCVSGLLAACGGTEESADTGDTTETTTTDTSAASDTTGTQDATDSSDDTSTTDTGDASDSSDSADDASGTTDAGDTATETGACDDGVWMVTYDLRGSQFEIRDVPLVGSQTTEISEGRMVIRFGDDNGDLATGEAAITEYLAELDFDVSGVVTDVTTESGPDECGKAKGEMNDGRIAWSTLLEDYRSHGTVTCNGGAIVCGAAQLPQGEPVEQDLTHDQELNTFTFDSEGNFDMDWVQVPSDEVGTTWIRYQGAEVSRECVATPSCG